MNKPVKAVQGTPILVKSDSNAPALLADGRDAIVIRAGTHMDDVAFEVDTPVAGPAAGFAPGTDYAVMCEQGRAFIAALDGPPADHVLGGFHYAAGGNAAARAGGDTLPAINPCSIWDIGFRPACPDPRGMALIEGPGGRFWADIYLLAEDHLKSGTSAFGVTIADGKNPPQDPAGGRYRKLDYSTAVAVMTHHGKGLLSVDEFFAAAFGVTEKSAVSRDPNKTGLDAARTSRAGLMQATGNLCVWCHDGDPDDPRPSIFGGSWFSGSSAGSRCANLDNWPEYSIVFLGARGRSDHLQHG